MDKDITDTAKLALTLAYHRPADGQQHLSRIRNAMGGGQHAVPADQGPTTPAAAAIPISYIQERHEGIRAVGYRRTAHYFGFEVSLVCRPTHFVPKGGVGTALRRYPMSASFLLVRSRGAIPLRQRQQGNQRGAEHR
jgi:hypothetical protein